MVGITGANRTVFIIVTIAVCWIIIDYVAVEVEIGVRCSDTARVSRAGSLVVVLAFLTPAVVMAVSPQIG